MLHTISIPGSKSLSNRALILAAISEKTTTIKNVAICDDTKYMIEGLKKLGIKCEQTGSTIKITGNNGQFKKQQKITKINTGNAGTTTRFLTAFATLTENEIIIDGDKRMKERPIKDLIQALNQLGAKVTSKNGYPPVHIYPQKLKGGNVKINGNISSQYLSAILMITALADKKTIINIEQNLCSIPYVQMTLELLKTFGINIVNKNFRQFEVKPKTLKSPKIITIEPDASSASYIGAYAALHPQKTVMIENIYKNSLQGDIAFTQYLKKMGCNVLENTKGIILRGPNQLKPLKEINMNETPDLVMTFAVLAMFTEGKTLIKNIENLRVKETDRISALKNEIEKFGIKVRTGKSFIEITGDPGMLTRKLKNPIVIETYNDHRIAMSFGILTDIFPTMKIKNPNCVSKSYTTFWKDIIKLNK